MNEEFKALTDGGAIIVKIDCAEDYTGVLLDNNELFMFGKNDRGQLGIGEGTGMDMIESSVFPNPVISESGKTFLVKDFYCGQNNMILKGMNDKIYLCGARMYHYPRLKDFEKEFEEDAEDMQNLEFE
jgi:alpha-tubulin suppressor-like RCC1 family protein